MNSRSRFLWYDAVVRDRSMTGLPVRVAWRILDRMGENEVSWPGAACLANELGASERRVRAATGALVRAGYLRVVRGGGKGKSNLYALKTDTLTTSL